MKPRHVSYPVIAYDTCPGCGKYSYESRKHAKAHARKLSRTDLSAYPCPHNPHMWHLGHLPRRVVEGRAGREDITPRSRP